MFRSKALRAALATRPEVSVNTVAATQVISRALGARNELYASVTSYETLAAKLTNPEAKEFAQFGSALALSRAESWEAARSALNPLVESGNTSTKRAALALRVKVNLALLDNARCAALVSGATVEGTASALTEAIRFDLGTLGSTDRSNYGPFLASGEFYIGQQGSHRNADEGFTAAIEKLKFEHHINTAELTTSSTVAHLARFEVNLAKYTPSVKSKILQASDRNEQLAAGLSELKAQFGGSLNNEEIAALASAKASIDSKHHYLDFFTAPEHNWLTNPFTVPLAARIDAFVSPANAFAIGAAALESRASTIEANEQFYAGDDKLKAALESDDILSTLASTCGAAPTSALSKTDNTYFDAVNTVDQFVATMNFAENSALQLSKDVAEQLSYRAVIGKAVAQEQAKDLDSALSALTSVIKSERCLDVWKAYLARGRVNRALGNVEESDADFKALHDLKKQVEGFDIPQLDENRYKSTF